MNRDVYKHILRSYGRNPGQWVGLIAAAIREFIARVYVVIIAAQVTSNIATGNYDAAKRHALYLLVAFTIGALIGMAGELLSLNSENREYGRLMMRYHSKLIHKDMAFYRDNQTGYLATSFRQYLDSSLLLVRFFRGEALGVVISLIVPATVLLIVAPSVGLVAFGIVLVQIVYVLWSSSKATKHRQLSNEVYRKITGEVSDEITNVVAFKSAGVERAAHGRMEALRQEELMAFWLRRKTTVILEMPRSIITAAGITLAVYLIIAKAPAQGVNSIGLLVLTITYMFQILRNVAALPELIYTHDDLVTKMYPTLKYLDEDYEAIRDPAHPKKLSITTATIDITGLSFSYPSHSQNNRLIPVFTGLNLRVPGGEQLGIVGLSGAGKSTLANLLLRFDEAQSGTIKIDGTDVRDVLQSELRQNIAYVPQEPLLFHRTVRENIAYYDNDASEAQIVQAAKAAHAHEFISKLPDGYDTVVGERGVKLSGGQKQRVAIARAVLKKAPIMLFDEATSALDSESEQIIQRALPEILGKQTAIVIAHRLSTIAGLDRIIVMHDGKVVEEGTHDQLLKQKGRYYSLWQKQTRS